MSDLDKLISLARVVRRAFERNNEETLTCLCYRVSFELFLVAKEHGIDVKLAGNSNHVFCILGDTVIDLTATQFGHNSKIAIGKVNKWPKEICFTNYWQVVWSGSSAEEVIKNGGWSLGHDHKHDGKLVSKEFEKENLREATL